jgi:hypothetical protein
MHHHEELRTSGPDLATALRRIMREGGENQHASSSSLHEKGQTTKHP